MHQRIDMRLVREKVFFFFFFLRNVDLLKTQKLTQMLHNYRISHVSFRLPWIFVSIFFLVFPQQIHISKSKTQSSFIEFQCPFELSFVEQHLKDALLQKSKTITFLTSHTLALLNLLNRVDLYEEQYFNDMNQCLLWNVQSLPTLEKISDILIMELDQHFMHKRHFPLDSVFFSKQELKDCALIIHFLILVDNLPRPEIMIWIFSVIPQESWGEWEKDEIILHANKWRDFGQWFKRFEMTDRLDIAYFLKREGVDQNTRNVGYAIYLNMLYSYDSSSLDMLKYETPWNEFDFWDLFGELRK